MLVTFYLGQNSRNPLTWKRRVEFFGQAVKKYLFWGLKNSTPLCQFKITPLYARLGAIQSKTAQKG